MVLAVEDALERAMEGGTTGFGEGIAHAQKCRQLDGGGDAQFVEVDHIFEDFAFGGGGAGFVAVIFKKRADEPRKGVDGLGPFGGSGLDEPGDHFFQVFWIFLFALFMWAISLHLIFEAGGGGWRHLPRRHRRSF